MTGIHMFMLITKLSSFSLYWVREIRYALITEAMYFNRFKKLIEFLHANDNTKNNDEGNKSNKLFQTQSAIYNVKEKNLPSSRPRPGPFYRRANKSSVILLIVESDSITFKNYVFSWSSRLMYDFFLHAGTQGTKSKKENLAGNDVALKLVENLPKHQNFIHQNMILQFKVAAGS